MTDPTAAPTRGPVTVLATAAFTLGAAHAAVSLSWLAGSTWLLDTVGGTLADWGADRSAPALVALGVVSAVKAGVAVLAPAAAGLGPRWLRFAPRRLVRALAWSAAVVLVGYGGVLTIVGIPVASGLIDLGEVADPYALRWHAYLWDPWFLLWGLCLAATLSLTRRQRPGRRG